MGDALLCAPWRLHCQDLTGGVLNRHHSTARDQFYSAPPPATQRPLALRPLDVSLSPPSHTWHISPDKASPFNEINDSINKMKTSDVWQAHLVAGKKAWRRIISVGC